jgi:sterol desaturase/sphingolipid hydroxylase (fatty acid hydroxylase superfamily)
MLPALSRLLVVVGALALLFGWERQSPLRKRNRPSSHRILVNAGFSLLTYVTAALSVRPASMATLVWSQKTSFGLLHWLNLGPAADGVLGFVLLDLSFYYWHRLNHEVRFLWRFHNVHHLDPDLDVTTGLRFHFGEVLFSTIFRAAQVILIGPSLPLFVAFEMIFQIETFFHHSNLRLPLSVDRLLAFFIVTPRMHAVHHSQFHRETDSNYSVIFSFWDRLHRTFRRGTADDIKIGVPGYSLDSDNTFSALLFAPFLRQRDYWQGLEER